MALSKDLRSKVTLDWPECFKLTYTDIAVYDLLLRNENKNALAVYVSSKMSGLFFRPNYMVVPSESQLCLTMAFQPVMVFDSRKESAWKERQNLHIYTVHLHSDGPTNVSAVVSICIHSTLSHPLTGALTYLYP